MGCRGLIFLLVVILSISCKHDKNQPQPQTSPLPSDPAFILRVNDMARFRSELKNNDFLANQNSLLLFKSMQPLINGMDYMNAQNSCVVGFYDLDEQLHFVLITDSEEDFFNLQNTSQKSVETLNHEDYTITRYEIDGLLLFSTVIDNFFRVSSSIDLLKKTLQPNQNRNSPMRLKKLFDAADSSKSANVFIPPNTVNSSVFKSKSLVESSQPLNGDWLSLDFNSTQNMLGLNGIAVANDSLPNLLSLFKGTSAQTNRTVTIASSNTDGILSFSFGDYASFASNRNEKFNDSIFNTIEEVGLIVANNERAVALNSFGTNNIAEFLDSKKTKTIDYQGLEIYEFSEPNLIAEAFRPLIKEFKSNFYTIIENTFVFTEKSETAQEVIRNYRAGSTFEKTPTYNNAIRHIAEESSILLICNPDGMDFLMTRGILPSFFTNYSPENLEGHVFASQIVADKTFYHTNFIISEIEKPSERKTVSSLFTLELDADLATLPQFVENHRTKTHEIVVQDIDNNLYLISNKGKVLWKKQLDGRIQGKIEQVDLYKNGKLQLAFCTNDQFLVLDRNGEIVAPFNMTFEGGNLNALAVFDYEKRKDYRFLVTQGQKIFMYNRKGEIVNGFKYTETESPIIDKPSHFRMGNKDYLVFQLENGALKIRHRAGQERIKVKDKIDFSNNGVFLYKNKFSLTDTNGVLHQIAPNGKLTRTNFNLNKDHGMYATSKTLALMDENVLSIKGKKVELELGVYTEPRIFYIYDKIYVAVTDIQSQKIHLYDSQAEPIPNFPVYGGSMIDLVDMDDDRKLELVSKNSENSIIVYRMN